MSFYIHAETGAVKQAVFWLDKKIRWGD